MTDTATSEPTGDLDAQNLEPADDGSTEKGGDPKPSSDGSDPKAGRKKKGRPARPKR